MRSRTASTPQLVQFVVTTLLEAKAQVR
jgi:hypothetical protein